MPERRENCKKNKQSVILTTIECRKEEKIVKKQIVSNTNYNRMLERREKCKKQIVSNTNHNRMPERRENCKKQIVSNTNHNRMPERRENCKKTNSQ